MKATVTVMLKTGVLDPQGRRSRMRWGRWGLPACGDVRAGKVIELELAETDPTKAGRRPRRWRASCWPTR